MTNKHSKYSKFLVGAASTVLVASAVAPVASAATFTDVTDKNTHKPAIDTLSDAGIIKGYENGTFKPNKTLTRSDVVKLMGKWLESLDYKIPADYKTKPRFTDLTSKSNDELLKYSALVKDHGVFKGYENGSLGAAGDITRENMAVVLVRAYDAVNDTNLIKHVNEQTFKKDVIDLAKAKPEARPAIDVLDYFDITNPVAPKFNPKATTTRGQFASFLHKTIQTKLQTVPEVPVVEAANITSVAAINEQMIELQGTKLNLLSESQFSVEGNKILSFAANAAGDKVIITFEKDFVSGEQQILTFTEKVTDQQDKVTPIKFTYELKIASVKASSDRINAATKNQHLGLIVNGQPSNLKVLQDAGYKVEFQTTKKVLKDASTGELDSALLKANDTFSYKVVISKAGVAVESELADIKVLDYKKYLTSISEVSVKQGSITVTSNKITVENGNVNVKAEKALTLDGTTLNTPTVTYASSNPAVASVDAATGVVTPISAGTATIIITADEAKKEVPLTVVSGEREVGKVTATTNTVKLLKGNTQEVVLTATDQYGDEFEGNLSVISKTNAIATGNGTIKFNDGKATATVKAVETGNVDIEIKHGEKVLSTIAVAISGDAVMASRALETVSATNGTQLDIVKGSDAKMLKLVWNKYNAGGYLIGPEKIIANSPTAMYSVSSTDKDVATASVDAISGEISVIAGLKTGTATIFIQEGTITRAAVQVTVVDSTPIISSVKFETVEDVKKSGAVNLPVLKADGITLSTAKYKPEIAADGTIFIDIEGNGYNKNNDITLGSLSTVYSGNVVADVPDLAISHGSVVATVADRANGTIVVMVKKQGDSAALATSTITVKVP